MYFRIFVFLFVLTNGFSFSVNAKDTLTGAMVSAYNTSGLLEQNRAVLRAADEDVASAASQLAPVVSWASSVSHSGSETSSYDTSGSVSISPTEMLQSPHLHLPLLIPPYFALTDRWYYKHSPSRL